MIATCAHVLAATTKETDRGRRYVKTPRSRALIAMAFACHRCS
ncbi:MAG: hypothetical protein ACR2L4_09345 [Actinomycetota bacterium]